MQKAAPEGSEVNMWLNDFIKGKATLAGLIGNPVEHSISPQLHNTLSSCLGTGMAYIPLLVDKNDLGTAVKGLRALNFTGFNVTIPYKKDIFKYIDECSREALLMGAVNTVKNVKGRLIGYNTDAEGFLRSFKEETGTGFKGKKVLLLGAGGTARAIGVKMALDGADSISIVNRTPSSAEEISALINENINDISAAFVYGQAAEKGLFSNSEIIVNTTSVGMHPNVDESPVGCEVVFSRDQVVYDVIYNPSRTRLLKSAEESGCKVVNGLGMLLYQGVFAYEIWTGVRVPQNVTAEIFQMFTKYLCSEGF
jgi:shikimate dehydrogenase